MRTPALATISLSLALLCGGCLATRTVVVADDEPVRLAAPVKARVAVNVAADGQPERWEVQSGRVTLGTGKLVVPYTGPGSLVAPKK